MNFKDYLEVGAVLTVMLLIPGSAYRFALMLIAALAIVALVVVL